MSQNYGGYQQDAQDLGQQYGGQQSGATERGYPTGGAQTGNPTGGAQNDYYQGQGQGQSMNTQQSGGYGQTNQMGNNQNQMGNNHMGGQQLGAGEPAGADQQDGLHKFLDKIEKKFGGDRFNNPANAEKNKQLNNSIIKKLKQVMKIVMQKGPGMAMRMMR